MSTVLNPKQSLNNFKVGTKIKKSLHPKRTKGFLKVLKVGIEPTRPCGQRILSPQRLPIPPLEHWSTKLVKRPSILQAFFVLFLVFFVQTGFASKVRAAKPTAIPTPHNSYWAPKSLQGGVGFGNAVQAGCSKFLFRWRGTGMFMYRPWLSGGLEVHQGGGLVSEDTVVSTDRYKIFARLHYSNSQDFISYVSPFMGFDDGSINSFQAVDPSLEEFQREEEDLDVCLEPGLRNGYDLGLEYGLGWRYHRLWTLTFSTSLSVRDDENFHNESTLGLVYDLTKSFPSVKRGANEIFIHSETIWVYRKGHWEVLALLGLSLGF